MEILEGDIRQAMCSRQAFAQAVDLFDGRELPRTDPVAEWGWIAAGFFDEHDELEEDWRRALVVASDSGARGVMFSRKDDVGHIVEWFWNGDRMLTTTTACAIIGNRLDEDPICDVHLAGIENAWRLIQRALPPAFLASSGPQLSIPLELGAEARLAGSDPRRAWGDFQSALAQDKVVRKALQASQQVFVTAFNEDADQTFSWFAGDDDVFYRIDDEGMFRVDSKDVHRTIEPLITITAMPVNDADSYDDPEAGWSVQ